MHSILNLTRTLLALALLLAPQAIRASETPAVLEGVGIEEHLGASLSISELSFLDEEGQAVTLSHYFKPGRPVILALVYYECPNLCNLLLNGFLESVKKIEWSVGNEFDVVAVSINPNETPSLADKKKANYLKVYNRPNSKKGWHFLTGQEDTIQTLAKEVGFQYRYDETIKQYAHTSALFILTPDGKISRYLYGISFSPNSLRLSLSEASNGKIGTVMERLILFCFHFDPSRNSYTFRMWRIVQIIITLQVVIMAGVLFTLWRKEKTPPNSKIDSIH